MVQKFLSWLQYAVKLISHLDLKLCYLKTMGPVVLW